ncbi:M24 family metallopeptidase [Salipaludibacillus agaradhaerens]|uniref:M24 family metallopeptidase n=1 Tax=Salipaludibacillus agaradhaerens TaxID=76935 RepID=UPI0021517ADA|nr:M24 family metallopeptidase [Salipaludibacillus agaradhaerens]MCR6107718.1 M24 family metallopeptidase [Salipaludibacillus agaradhaerens]MCR6119747.1 M24 family metallopeptidase [Salipaludibacillus agaradhaerens]UJW58808.1 M24 family metallopeptidase [Bacillus sp. A116_S68]
MLPFDLIEYQKRLHKTKSQMEKKGIEVLLVTDPANMNYLTGYDAWSFYVHQMVAVIIDEPQPIWLGRFQDANGAKLKTWLYEENIIAYPDYYVHSESYHPMDFMARILTEIGQGNRRIGIEMDHYYFSAKAFEQLRLGLPNAEFISADLLVNGVRLIKSDKEIEYMERAARLAEQAMYHGIETIRAGVRECEVAAKIYYYMIAGTEEFGGDYPAIVPLLPSGKNTGIPHLTWTDRKLDEGDSIVIELAGCYHRYHAPLARTVSIGAPPPALEELGPIVTEGVNRVLDAAKPGVTCGELEEVWRKIIRKYGIEKEARLGYSVGLGYPPDWGEHTASIRRHDKTVLQPNMTFHLIPALWFDHYGLEISETFKVSESGSETLTQFSRELIVKHPFMIPHQDGEIS